MDEFRVVVVASRFKPEDQQTFNLLTQGLITLVDRLHFEDPDRKGFALIHNGVTYGPLSELFKAVNFLETPMRSFGRYFRRNQVKMDVLLHGKDTERLWLEDNIKGADAVFVINDGHLSRDVKQVLEDSDVYQLEVKVEKARWRR